MSTDMQIYSLENQAAMIAVYAAARDIEVVRTYRDEGKSGLTISGRHGLEGLLADIESGTPGFSVILVYDVSRWGRFQDVDESAYYEFLCKKAGITVVYCAEQFENDGTAASTIMKTLKRVMAGEYSRELSVKIKNGSMRIASKGFKVGGTAGFGLGRQLVAPDGRPKALLRPGQRKSFQGDRVRLVLGPKREVEAVRFMFRMVVEKRLALSEIATLLNTDGPPRRSGKPWDGAAVRGIVSHPKYAGMYRYNRVSSRLTPKRTVNPREEWMLIPDATPAMVTREVFELAQRLRRQNRPRIREDVVVEKLKALYRERGKISEKIIREARAFPSLSTVMTHFGGMLGVYEVVGHVPARGLEFLRVRSEMRLLKIRRLEEIAAELRERGFQVRHLGDRNLLLLVDERIYLALTLSRRREGKTGDPKWKVGFWATRRPDLTLVETLTADLRYVVTRYLFAETPTHFQLTIGSRNRHLFERYRVPTMEAVYGRLSQYRAAFRGQEAAAAERPG
ncbi:MAG: recombinase family protein [Rhodospirillaceae bacterium]|nr:recombinase family protein [Rhodospirillaceae bacterium]